MTDTLTLQAPSPAPQPARCRCGRYVGSVGIVLLDEYGCTIDARPRCLECCEGVRRHFRPVAPGQLRLGGLA